jgi:NADPH:quinone reductase-like Zn-dependent oxidoreductase
MDAPGPVRSRGGTAGFGREGNAAAPEPVAESVSRAVVHDSFGGTEVLRLIDRETPVPGPDELRVRVSVAGLNPVDWQIVESGELAAEFGIAVPSGFGNDFAGVVEAVGSGVSTWRIGDRVFGGARGAAVAEHLIVPAASQRIHRTPAGVDDATAGVLDIAGRTASAVADALALGPDDTVLIGAAGGGVGTILTQLATLAGARVLGTGGVESAVHIRSLGAQPLRYGPGLLERVRLAAPEGITAAADLFGTETAVAALQLGAPAGRVVTIEADDPPSGARPVNGSDARPGALLELLRLVQSGGLRVPIAATFPLDEFQRAVDLQRARHARGKVAVVMA